MSTYTVQGMTCDSCAAKVAGAVNQVAGVTGTDVDLAAGTLTVAGPDVDNDAVRTAITDAGYQVG
jgi:copper chaperone CopZ